jgi:hypothetical protein
MTGMGEVVPIGDSEALAEAVIRVLDEKEAYVRPGDVIGESFSPAETAREYVSLFEQLRAGKQAREATEPPAYERLRGLKRKDERK